MTDTDVHIRRLNPTHVDVTCRSFGGIHDVTLTGSCSCGARDCSHLAAVLAWLIPARPTKGKENIPDPIDANRILSNRDHGNDLPIEDVP